MEKKASVIHDRNTNIPIVLLCLGLAGRYDLVRVGAG
jgi:hypothetical protein